MGTCDCTPGDNLIHVEDIEQVLNSDVHNMRDVLDQYKLGRTIGSGATSRVYVASHKDDPNDQIAIKMLDKTAKNKILYQGEIDVLRALTPDITKPQRGILPFICNGEDSNHYYIVTRLLTGTDLFDRIISKDDKYKITEKMAVKLCKDMLLALKYCHDKGVIHSDLKPENFVFAHHSLDSDIILIDFGSAAIVNDDENIDRVAGTAEYVAPELAAAALDNRRKKGQKVNRYVPLPKPRNGAILKASDVYSIGVIAHVMMTGRVPFYGDNAVATYEATCIKPLIFPQTDARYHNQLLLSDLFMDFMVKTLTKDPLKRITVEEAINHGWICGGDVMDSLSYLKQFSYQSMLKKEITRAIADNIAHEPRNKVLAHFNRLDIDSDGVLNVNDLIMTQIEIGYTQHQAKEEAHKMIDAADINKDGVIDFDEFKRVYYRKVLKTNDEYIHRTFNVFDKNHDGVIDSDDLKLILFEKESIKNKRKAIHKIVKEVDTKGNGVIDFKEFEAAMHEDQLS